MKKCTIFLAIFLLSATCYAGEYILVKGKGVEVCEEYGKNLNSFKLKKPMEYSRKINPDLKEFSKPQWERVYGNGLDRFPRNGEVLASIGAYLWERDANPIYYIPVNKWSKWRGTKRQYTAAYKKYNLERYELGSVPRMHLIADIDIDNDGTTEPVYLDRLYPTSGALLLVLKPDYSAIDYEKTKLVMMHPSRKEMGAAELKQSIPLDIGHAKNTKKAIKPVVDALHGVFYGVFYFKDKTYFDMWGFHDSKFFGAYDPNGRLRVFIADKRSSAEICTYKFVSSAK
jgi:hypothetical protein